MRQTFDLNMFQNFVGPQKQNLSYILYVLKSSAITKKSVKERLIIFGHAWSVPTPV